jgi:glutamate/tyrosine decarboxylase-like PLP-dependent enzyme
MSHHGARVRQTEIEGSRAVLDAHWCSELAHGLLTSGGSMANLTAVRLRCAQSPTRKPPTRVLTNGPLMTIYASEEIHMSIARLLTSSVSGVIKSSGPI